MSDLPNDLRTRMYCHPPVDPVSGEVSAADDAVLMGQMRHCDVPQPHRKDGCTAIMEDHRWIDNGVENGDGTIGITVCPTDDREQCGPLL